LSGQTIGRFKIRPLVCDSGGGRSAAVAERRLERSWSATPPPESQTKGHRDCVYISIAVRDERAVCEEEQAGDERGEGDLQPVKRSKTVRWSWRNQRLFGEEPVLNWLREHYRERG
jgi:hypothetical protein